MEGNWSTAAFAAIILPIKHVSSDFEALLEYRSLLHLCCRYNTLWSRRKKLMCMELTTTPRNSVSCEGNRIDFSKFTTNPRFYNKWIVRDASLKASSLREFKITCRLCKCISLYPIFWHKPPGALTLLRTPEVLMWDRRAGMWTGKLHS